MNYSLFKRHGLAAIESVVPIIDKGYDFESTRITNIQSTVVIIDKGCLLQLKSIVLSLSGMAKHNPKRFAAVIIRAYFGVHVTTCMVFDSGKIVVIGALSLEHSRYAAQMYRRMISNVKSLYYDSKTNKHIFTDLSLRSKFDDFGVHNIVATTKLKYGINQKSFRDTKQRDANYEPESFPGCPFLVWIRPREKCQCEKKKATAKYSCDCNIQTSLFGSGKINLTGSKSIRDTNRAKHIIMHLTKNFSQSKKIVPKEKRFQLRRQAIFKVSVNNTGYQPLKKRRRVKTIKLKSLLKRLPEQKNNQIFENVENLFVKACLMQQIYMVRYLKEIAGDNVDIIGDAVTYMKLNMINEMENDNFIKNIFEKLMTI